MIAGPVIFWVGAFTPPYRQWMGVPLDEYLGIVAANPGAWRFMHACFAIGAVVTACGICGLAGTVPTRWDREDDFATDVERWIGRAWAQAQTWYQDELAAAGKDAKDQADKALTVDFSAWSRGPEFVLRSESNKAHKLRADTAMHAWSVGFCMPR